MKGKLFWLAGGTLAAASCATDKADRQMPNVVFILADDLGWGDLSCYGQERFETPNIDALAANGLRFTQCYSGTTVSAPSRRRCVLDLPVMMTLSSVTASFALFSNRTLSCPNEGSSFSKQSDSQSILRVGIEPLTKMCSNCEMERFMG